MKVIKGYQTLSQTFTHPVVAIGNFDGVHLGHQKIIEIAKEKAKEKLGQSIAFTFKPHPKIALHPERKTRLLSTYDEKLELLARLGLDFTIEEPFSREFSSIEPEEFFNSVLRERIHAEAIIVGYDFAFGKDRHGHLDTLKAFCEKSGVELLIIPAHRLGEEIVSSSQIRHHLMNGQIEAANLLLGRPFSYKGPVIKGDGKGHQIGFPTANLRIDQKITLPYGVYTSWTHIQQRSYPSVTNVGVRPTFHAHDPQSLTELPVLVETHLLDQDIDLYGSTIEVQFLKRIREERKFSSVDELRKQIQHDVLQAQKDLQF